MNTKLQPTEQRNHVSARRIDPWSMKAALCALCSVAVSIIGTPPARAQSFPTTFQIAEHHIQKSPAVFKFQSRISQAKIPVGDAVFGQLVVNVVQGANVLCTESFSNVRVRDSVLNLEIGRAMTCLLDEIIAENNGLAFQVCIGGSANCLKPIDLGSVPYAVKSSYASVAQIAHNSDVAAQANYAHRVTADRDLLVTDQIGTGYFDFYTPPAATRLYSSPAAYAPYREGGFIQWVPVNQVTGASLIGSATLNICAQDLATGEPAPLSELVLYADTTTMRSNMVVEGNTNVAGHATISTGATIANGAAVSGGLTVTGGGTVSGGATMSGGATVNQGFTVTDTAAIGADLVCQGDAEVLGNAVFWGNVDVHGTVNASINGVANNLNCTGCVSSTDIATDTITAGNIAAGGVGSSEIADGSITFADIATDTIWSGNIGAGAVGSSEIGDNSVDSIDIADSTVTSFDIALDTVAALDIAAGAVGSSEIADNSILSVDISDGAVSSADIADTTVTSADIALDTIAAVDIAAGAVGSSEIADGSVFSIDIADGSVNFADIAPNTITAGNIAAGAVGGSEILDGAVTSADIAPGAITNAKLGLSLSEFIVDTHPLTATPASVTATGKVFCALSTYAFAFVGSAGTSLLNDCSVTRVGSDWTLEAASRSTEIVWCRMTCF